MLIEILEPQPGCVRRSVRRFSRRIRLLVDPAIVVVINGTVVVNRSSCPALLILRILRSCRFWICSCWPNLKDEEF